MGKGIIMGGGGIGVDTSDATAVAGDIRKNKIAYGVNGKIIGTAMLVKPGDYAWAEYQIDDCTVPSMGAKTIYECTNPDYSYENVVCAVITFSYVETINSRSFFRKYGVEVYKQESDYTLVPIYSQDAMKDVGFRLIQTSDTAWEIGVNCSRIYEEFYMMYISINIKYISGANIRG